MNKPAQHWSAEDFERARVYEDEQGTDGAVFWLSTVLTTPVGRYTSRASTATADVEKNGASEVEALREQVHSQAFMACTMANREMSRRWILEGTRKAFEERCAAEKLNPENVLDDMMRGYVANALLDVTKLRPEFHAELRRSAEDACIHQNVLAAQILNTALKARVASRHKARTGQA